MRKRTLCYAASLALLICGNMPANAAVKMALAAAPTAAADAARTRLLMIVDDAKKELVLDASTRASLVQSSATAQTQLAASQAQAVTAQDASLRLNAVAKELRRQAYAISDLPGLSADQNHKSVAAMEAADAAENEARVAQFAVATTAATATHDRTALDALTLQLAALDSRVDACNRLLKLNGAALAESRFTQR